jgi:hypothetical protein
MFSERYAALFEKRRDISSDGSAAYLYPAGYASPLQTMMAIWRTFFQI